MSTHSKTQEEALSLRQILLENKKELLFLFFLAIFAATLASFWNTQKKESPEAQQQAIRVLTMDEVKIDDYEKDRKRWRILGEQAIVFADSRNTLIKKVEILIYSPEAYPELVVDLRITADQGLLEGENRKVILTGNVQSTRGKDFQLNTDKAIYNYQTGLLQLPESVQIHQGKSTVFGENLIYTLKDKKMKLQRVTLMQ